MYPKVGNSTFPHQGLVAGQDIHKNLFLFQLWHKDENRICNVGRNCHKSNLRVKPEKGKAILWYSHFVDEETGWLGESDPYSYHGGCDVIKGTKWIANNWISVSENRTKDIELWLQTQQIWRNPSRDHDNFVTTEADEDDEIFKAVKQETGARDKQIDSLFDAVSESLNEDHDSGIEFDQNQRNELQNKIYRLFAQKTK